MVHPTNARAEFVYCRPSHKEAAQLSLRGEQGEVVVGERHCANDSAASGKAGDTQLSRMFCDQAKPWHCTRHDAWAIWVNEYSG